MFKAASLIRLASFRRLLETDTSRRIVGFDAFGAFPHADRETGLDSEFIDLFEREAGEGLRKSEVMDVLARKGFSNIELVEGDVLETLPEWLNENPAAQISFLHLDMDVYEPTIAALEACYERVVRGGLVVIDDYSSVDGATRAVNEFLARRDLRLSKMPYYSTPAYFAKP